MTLYDAFIVALAVAVLLAFFRLRWYMLHRAPTPLGLESTSTGILLFIAFILLSGIGVGVTSYLVGIDAVPTNIQDHAQLMVGVCLAQALGVVGYLWLRAPLDRQREIRRFGTVGVVAFGVATFVATIPVLYSVSMLVKIVIAQPIDVIAHDTLRLFVESPVDEWFVVLVVCVVVCTPIIEEIMYRGVLQRLLVQSGLPRWPAIGVASVLFAVIHIGSAEWHALPALFVLSLVLGWSYEKTGRLTTPVVIHILFNAVNLILAMSLNQTSQ